MNIRPIAATAAAVAISAGSAGAVVAESANAATHRPDATLSTLDRSWLKASIQTDLTEIKGGLAAEKKSTQPQVLKLARTIVAQHRVLLKGTSKLARELGVPVPTRPSPSQTATLNSVARQSSATFNVAFAKAQVAGHETAATQTRREISHGSNSLVRRNARTGLPMIEMHLTMARQALKAVATK